MAALAGDVGGGDDGGMLMMEFSEARSSSAVVCVGSQRRNALQAGSIDRPFVVVRPFRLRSHDKSLQVDREGEWKRGAGQGLEVDAVISEGEIDSILGCTTKVAEVRKARRGAAAWVRWRQNGVIVQRGWLANAWRTGFYRGLASTKTPWTDSPASAEVL